MLAHALGPGKAGVPTSALPAEAIATRPLARTRAGYDDAVSSRERTTPSVTVTGSLQMSYIERELTDGEQVVLLGRVSWWTIVPQTLLVLATLVAAVVAATALSALMPLFWTIALPLASLVWLVMVARQVFRVLTTEIAITDRRVMSKTGLLRTEVKVTPLTKVNNVNVQQSFLGNLFDYGDIEVTTATAEENDNHLIASLAHVDEFRNTLSAATPS
jgi:membrane protein YdbS with pleckstrin-like domain